MPHLESKTKLIMTASVNRYINPFYYLLQVGGILLLAIAVLVIDPYQTAAEGEYFAKGNEDRVMDLAQWWAEEARHQHCASKDAQCSSGDELEVFHGLGILSPTDFTDFSRI